ncbi:hypothetical protein EL22_21805 [Halostagnicola sp. A56]|nr:hypothetical protein EL22_21805 [Halostagnicola sp. A56]
MDGDGLEWGPIQWADAGTFADADYPEPTENERRFYTIAIRRGWGENTNAASIAVLGVTRDLEIGLETRYRATSEDWTLCDRDGVPPSVCKRPPADSAIPTARKDKFRQVLKRAHNFEDSAVDARHESANEVRADGGIRESEQVDRAVREAATLIDAGDSTTVAINYVVDEYELEHRRADIHQHVRDRLEQAVVTDGGHNPDDLVVLMCDPCNYQTIVARGTMSITSCPDCQGDLEIDHTRVAHQCPDSTVNHVIVEANERCPFCQTVQKAIAADGGRDAFLAGDAHYCDLCENTFETLGELIRHDCQDQQAIADGGRPQHRADCEDCSWSYRDTDLVDVSDEMERHARKEMHDVDLERAVATDGGQCVDETERCEQCGGPLGNNPRRRAGHTHSCFAPRSAVRFTGQGVRPLNNSLRTPPEARG